MSSSLLLNCRNFRIGCGGCRLQYHHHRQPRRRYQHQQQLQQQQQHCYVITDNVLML